MRALFNWQRTGIFWWGVITALVFMIHEAWVLSFAASLRAIDTSSVDFLQPLSDEVDRITREGLKLIRFDPNGALVYFGNYGIANVFVGIVFIILFLIIGLGFYVYAIRTKTILDDFIAMALLYVIMRVIGVASTVWKISVLAYVHEKEPTSYLILLTIFMLILLGKGDGWTNSQIFFKIIFEAVLVWVVIAPDISLGVLAWIVERPAILHQVLTRNDVISRYYPMVIAIWGLVGLGIAAVNLYGANRLAAPAGGGGGGGGGKEE